MRARKAWMTGPNPVMTKQVLRASGRADAI
jgi:hypothetical protein